MSDELNRAIGKMEGRIEALITLIEKMDKRSDESRSKMYSRIEQMEQKVNHVSTGIDSVQERLGKVEPIVGEIPKWKERVVGARIALMMIVAGAGASVYEALRWLLQHLPRG